MTQKGNFTMTHLEKTKILAEANMKIAGVPALHSTLQELLEKEKYEELKIMKEVYEKRIIAHQCQHCGVFSKYDELDSYTPYGCSSYNPPEPHDPIVICKVCSQKLYEKYKEQFARGEYKYGDWYKSNAERKAAKEAGLVWIGNNSSIEWNGKRAFNEYIPKEIYENAIALSST